MALAAKASGKIKFFVVDADAKASTEYKDAVTHKIKLSLQAVDEANSDPATGEAGKVKVGGDSRPKGKANTGKARKHLGGDG